MKKLQIFGALFLAMLSCFTIGYYTTSTLYLNKSIEPHRWAMTGSFGMMFLLYFLNEYRKK